MTTQTLTLTDFLLERIAEDEAEARKVRVPVRNGSLLGVMRLDVAPHDSLGSHDGPAVAIVVSPTRVLADCEAKRQIVAWLTTEGHPDYGVGPLLNLLALPYADHEDYREEWRV